MNESYLNGSFHEWVKRLREVRIQKNERNWHKLCFWISVRYRYLRYVCSTPDGPLFIVKLLIAVLDYLWYYGGRFYLFNQNPICRSSNHSSVLSKKQNIGWVLKYNLHYKEAIRIYR